MKINRLYKHFLIISFFICAAEISLYFYKTQSFENKYDFLAQNTYLGPTHPIPNEDKLIKIQVLVKDSPDLAGVQIENAYFNQEQIPLKPRDIFGKRGEASFQVFPGKYTLKWTVNRDKIVWPRKTQHEEEVYVSPRDLWVQIMIEGDHASIR